MTAKICFAVLIISVAQCHAAPLRGCDLPPRHDNVTVVNEPCYVHDSACGNGAAVCCVTAGTCVSQHSGVVSSTVNYYEGGCQSFASSLRNWDHSPNCTQQGECLVQHLMICKGWSTLPQYMSPLPDATRDRLVDGIACEQDCDTTACVARSWGGGGYGGGGSNTGPTTTTTTLMSLVEKTLEVEISDATAVSSGANLETMLKRVVAAMAGFETTSVISMDVPSTMAQSMAIDFTVRVSSLHDETAQGVMSRMDSHTDDDINDMLAQVIGDCSYTVTVSDFSRNTDDSDNAHAAKASRLLLSVLVTVVASVWTQ